MKNILLLCEYLLPHLISSKQQVNYFYEIHVKLVYLFVRNHFNKKYDKLLFHYIFLDTQVLLLKIQGPGGFLKVILIMALNLKFIKNHFQGLILKDEINSRFHLFILNISYSNLKIKFFLIANFIHFSLFSKKSKDLEMKVNIKLDLLFL